VLTRARQAKLSNSVWLCIQMLYTNSCIVDSCSQLSSVFLNGRNVISFAASFTVQAMHPLLLSTSLAGQDAVRDQFSSLWPPWLKLGKRNYIICRMCKLWCLPPSKFKPVMIMLTQKWINSWQRRVDNRMPSKQGNGTLCKQLINNRKMLSCWNTKKRNTTKFFFFTT
jgi:hypothetical protein